MDFEKKDKDFYDYFSETFSKLLFDFRNSNDPRFRMLVYFGLHLIKDDETRRKLIASFEYQNNDKSCYDEEGLQLCIETCGIIARHLFEERENVSVEKYNVQNL